MRKNYVISEPIDSSLVTDALHLTDGESYSIDTGTSQATLIDFSNLHYGRVRRKWMVVIPEFANEWSNDLHAMLTDDDKVAEEFITEWGKQQDSYSDERQPDFDEDMGDYRYYPELAGRWFNTFAQERENFWKQFQL